MTPHELEQQGWLGRSSRKLLLPLLLVPGSLRFIKYNGMLVGWLGGPGPQPFLQEVVNVLDSCSDLPSDLLQRDPPSLSGPPRALITSKGFPQYSDKWRVSRQIHNVPSSPGTRRDGVVDNLEPRERLARSGHPGQECQESAPFVSCLHD
jgi:hypothetical protein